MTKKKKILIVEDETTAALFIKEYFDDSGFNTCDTASNYEKALELYNTENPDAILVDIRLAKGPSGIDLSKKIREKNKTIPIVFMTGYDDESTRNETALVNPLGFFPKPIDLNKIVEVFSDYFSIN